MKHAYLKILMLAAIATFSFGAFAESVASKSHLKVDFNKMINESTLLKNELQRDLNNEEPVAEASHDLQEKAVVDFIDMELSIGEQSAAPVVDRRYDSVDDAS